MPRALTVPPAARAAFALALAKELSPHAGALPDPLPMGRVLRIVDRAVETEDELKVLAGRNVHGYFLDYYRVDNDRDGQTFWHGRIREDGTLENLENLEGQWGVQVFSDDPARTQAERERIRKHNERVREILRAKGFA